MADQGRTSGKREDTGLTFPLWKEDAHSRPGGRYVPSSMGGTTQQDYIRGVVRRCNFYHPRELSAQGVEGCVAEVVPAENRTDAGPVVSCGFNAHVHGADVDNRAEAIVAVEMQQSKKVRDRSNGRIGLDLPALGAIDVDFDARDAVRGSNAPKVCSDEVLGDNSCIFNRNPRRLEDLLAEPSVPAPELRTRRDGDFYGRIRLIPEP